MLLKIRKNAQITLPAGVRKAAHLEDGDLLDCEVQNGQIVLTPKKLVDKRDAWFWSPEWQKAEAEAQEDIASGDVTELESIDELIDHLKGE
jgi:AbrB family looped-hinge helix DNA binding protein